MNHENGNDTTSAVAPSPGNGPASPSRRRFGAAGMAGGGVLLTLTCKPVLGGVVSAAPSGFLSANQSTHGAAAFNGARLPAFWMSTSLWPIDASTQFGQVFNCNLDSDLGRTTFKEMISGKKTSKKSEESLSSTVDPNQLGMYLCTAMLNARNGWTPFLPDTRITEMYSEYALNGFYSPTATTKWTDVQIVQYLKSTQS